jgi:hypothetical protein
MPPDGRSLVLEPERAASTCRDVGPTAWCVLETLARSGPGADRRGRVEASTRSLAATLGLSKDTIARAVSRLIAAGLVKRSSERHRTSGRFGQSVYLIDLDAAGISLEHVLPPVRETSPSRPLVAPRSRRDSAGPQLSLLADDVS